MIRTIANRPGLRACGRTCRDDQPYDAVVSRMLVFLALCLHATMSLWLPFQSAMRLAILFALGLHLFLSRQRRTDTRPGWRRYGMLLIALLLLGAIHQDRFDMAWYLMPLFLLACVAVRDGRCVPDQEDRSLVLVALTFAVAALFFSPAFSYRCYNAVSTCLPPVLKVFTRNVAQYGPSDNGLFIVSATVPFLLWSVVLSGRWQPRHTLFLLFLAALVFLQYAWEQKYLLLLLACLAVASLSARHAVKPAPPGPGRGGILGMAALVLFLAGGFLGSVCWSRGGTPDDAQRIAFASGATVLWDLPTYDGYGAQALPYGAQFGVFRKLFLPSYGFEECSMEDLLRGPRGILTVINPNTVFPPAEQERIWRFVERGGALLVLGDHTDIGGIQRPLNELLQPVGIRFNYDSAIPLDEGWHWFGCIKRIRHPALHRVQHEGHLRISVGASLSLSRAATPLLIGVHAYSDQGRPEYGASHLGNMKYDVGERRGDLVLAAESSYGAGKVVVFGDTSSFQSAVVGQTHYFMADLLHYLAGPAQRPFFQRHPLPGILGFVVCVVLLGMIRNEPRQLPVALAVMALSFLLPLTESGASDRHGPQRRVAVVDISHGTPFVLTPEDMLGCEGLQVNILRAGYLPVMIDRFDAKLLEKSEYYFICGPSRSYGTRERRAIEAYVRRGGHLILASGRTGRYGGRALLGLFGVQVGPLLGSAHMATLNTEERMPSPEAGNSIPAASSDPPSSVDADPGVDRFVRRELGFYAAWALLDAHAASRVLCSSWNYPLILMKNIGDGAVCLIGDDHFFANRNLETPSPRQPTVSDTNIRFFRRMLQELDGPKKETPASP